ncbi:MAG: hypothetical protein ACJAYU_002594 [Bradymonadia bacterium]|jgi:hypothetical protein
MLRLMRYLVPLFAITSLIVACGTDEPTSFLPEFRDLGATPDAFRDVQSDEV